MVKNRRILVTGATGFTGRHFLEAAGNAGYTCYGLSRTKQLPLPHCIEMIQADITDKESLRAAVKKTNPHYVVHLAAISFVAHKNPADFYKTNVEGSINILESIISEAPEITKVLMVSSGNAYGSTKELPISETIAPSPINDYGVSKLSMELAAQIRSKTLPIVIVRPFNYTGRGQAKHFLIPKVVNAYRERKKTLELGNLNVARDYSDVRDVVQAYLRLLESTSSNGVYNICSGASVPVRSILDMLSELAGYELDIETNSSLVRSNEIIDIYGDNTRSSKAIGNYQHHSLSDTLKWMFEE